MLEVVPTTVCNGDEVFLNAHMPPQKATATEETQQTNFHPMFDDASEQTRQMMNFVEHPTQWSTLIKAILDGILVAVTDGLYDPFRNVAAVCWILEGKNGEG